jgi:hypothetical protein
VISTPSTRFWSGHTGQGITDRYSKLAENVELRKEWAARAGLGFELHHLGKLGTPHGEPSVQPPSANPTKPDPRRANIQVKRSLIKRRIMRLPSRVLS